MAKHKLWLTAATLAAACMAALPAFAHASPVLDVEITRFPTQVNRGDESLAYEVVVRNSGADATSGSIAVALSFSPGLEPLTLGGAGWTCSTDLSSCVHSASVPPGGAFPVLTSKQVVIDQDASDPGRLGVSVSGGGASPSSAEDSFAFGPAVPFGLTATAAFLDEAGGEEARAGVHPFEVTGSLEIPRRRSSLPAALVPVEPLHSGVAELPPGTVANPGTVGVCEFVAVEQDTCPASAAVGGVSVSFGNDESPQPEQRVAYRLPGEDGYPFTFGFRIQGELVYVIRLRLRSDGDYGVSQVLPLVPQNPPVYGIAFSLCGFGVERGPLGEYEGCRRRDDPAANTEPFITLGTACPAAPSVTRFAVDSWTNRGLLGGSGLPDLSDPAWKTAVVEASPRTGCARLTEEWTGIAEPSLRVHSDSSQAASPAAFTVGLHVPQGGLSDPNGVATAHLKEARIALPPGVSVNPGLGDGLESCSASEIGWLGGGFPPPSRNRFDAHPPDCPAGSKVGTAVLRTPLFPRPLEGSVYLAAQGENPFGSDFAAYVVVEEPGLGVTAKLPVKVELDPETGQVRAILPDGPQLPLEDLELSFFGGPRAALLNPIACGAHKIAGELVPWSAADPERPLPEELARPAASFLVSDGPDRSRCIGDASERPFRPGFSAGSASAVAGAATSFLGRLTREDAERELIRFRISPPPGFVGSLRGVSSCPAGDIAAAASGSGRAERGLSSCPGASQIGEIEVAAGAGGSPLRLPGRVFLTGPYHGAPLGLAAIVPAVAGPFDLGNVVIRSALEVDPRTARVTLSSDPIPTIVDGIPLRVREVRVRLNRPGWARNPTSCDPMAVAAEASGTGGASTSMADRFQVGGCASLPFRPKLSVRLSGPAHRSANPRLRVVFGGREGDANVRRAGVVLPPTEILDIRNVRKVCSAASYAASTCPPGSVYGRVEVWSPLLNRPLRGPVYLRSSDRRLPDLVAPLEGEVGIDLVGQVDSVRGRIRATFPAIPDVPVSKVAWTLFGGRRSLLANNTDLCAATIHATARLRGHNGKSRRLRTTVETDCPPRR